jgi:hypothetical protein
MGDDIDLKKVELALGKLSEAITEQTAHIDRGFGEVKTLLTSVQNSINLVYEDREILLKISGKIAGLTDETLNHRQCVDNANKDLKADIAIASGAMVDKVAEVKKVIETNVGGLVDAVAAKKSVVVVHDSILSKLTKRFFTTKGVKK